MWSVMSVLTHVRVRRLHYCWHRSPSHLSVGMLAIDPGVSQMLLSPGHQHRSTEVRSQDCNNHGYVSAVGIMGVAQILAWLKSLCVCAHKVDRC